MSFAAELKDFASGFKTGYSLADKGRDRALKEKLYNARINNESTDEYDAAKKREAESTAAHANDTGTLSASPTQGKAMASTGAVEGDDAKAAGKERYDYLINLGVPANLASGMVGNAYAESKFDSNVSSGGGDQGTAHGEFQWRGDRFNNLLNFAKQTGQNPNDWRTQYQFAWHETKQLPMFKSMMAAKDPSHAADLFALNFERPKGAETGDPNNIHQIGNRRNYAQSFSYGMPAPTSGNIAAAWGSNTPKVATAIPTQPAAQPAAQPAVTAIPATSYADDGTDNEDDSDEDDQTTGLYADGGAVDPYAGTMRAYTQPVAADAPAAAPAVSTWRPRQIGDPSPNVAIPVTTGGYQQRFRDMLANREAAKQKAAADAAAAAAAAAQPKPAAAPGGVYSPYDRASVQARYGPNTRLQAIYSPQGTYYRPWRKGTDWAGNPVTGGWDYATHGQGSQHGGGAGDYAAGGMVSPNDYGSLDPGDTSTIREGTSALWRLDAQAQQRAQQRLHQRDQAYTKVVAKPAAAAPTGGAKTPTGPRRTAKAGDEERPSTVKETPMTPPAVTPEASTDAYPGSRAPGAQPMPPPTGPVTSSTQTAPADPNAQVVDPMGNVAIPAGGPADYSPPPSDQGGRPAYGPGMNAPAPNQPRDVYAIPSVPGAPQTAVPSPSAPVSAQGARPAYGPGVAPPAPNDPRAPYAPAPIQPTTYATPGSQPIPLPTVEPPQYEGAPTGPAPVTYATPAPAQTTLGVAAPGQELPPTTPTPGAPLAYGPGVAPPAPNEPRAPEAAPAIRGPAPPQAIPTPSALGTPFEARPELGGEPTPPAYPKPTQGPPKGAAPSGKGDRAEKPWIPQNVPEGAVPSLEKAWKLGLHIDKADNPEEARKVFQTALKAARRAGVPNSVIEAYADNFGVDAPPKTALDTQGFAEGGAVEDDEMTPANTQAAAADQPIIPAGGGNYQAATPQQETQAKGGTAAGAKLIDPEAIKESTHAGLKWINDVLLQPQRGTAIGPDPNAQSAQQKFDTNDHALTQQDMAQLKNQVDPEYKLSEPERIMKVQQDMFDFYTAHGNAYKAAQAAASVLMYGRRVSQTSGIMAQAALAHGDMATAGKWMAKAYETLPDGKQLRIDDQPVNGKLGYQIVDLDSGKVEQEGQASAQDMQTMAQSMSSGIQWAKEAQRIAMGTGAGYASGRSTGTGTRGMASQQAKRDALNALQQAGEAVRADPSDENKQAFEQRETEALGAGVPAGSTKLMRTRYGLGPAPKVTEAQRKRDEAAQAETENQGKLNQFDADIQAAGNDPVKLGQAKTAKTGYLADRAFNTQAQANKKRVVNMGQVEQAISNMVGDPDQGLSQEDGNAVKALAPDFMKANGLDGTGTVGILRTFLDPNTQIVPQDDGSVQLGDQGKYFLNAKMLSDIAQIRRAKKRVATGG